jgi:hypothetical protein
VFDGMLEERNYRLLVHGSKPQMIFIKSDELKEMKDTAKLERAEDGWYFDLDRNITHIKVKVQKAKTTFSAIIFRDGN